ncbi:MAG: hypothetical protein WKF77_22925 [Planctomycetaceae bacterium]
MIAAVLSTMDRKLDILEGRLAIYTQQKKGLMQQRLTGKASVNVESEKAKA